MEEVSYCEGGEECIGCENENYDIFYCLKCSREIKRGIGFIIPVQYLINRPHMKYKSREITKVTNPKDL